MQNSLPMIHTVGFTTTTHSSFDIDEPQCIDIAIAVICNMYGLKANELLKDGSVWGVIEGSNYLEELRVATATEKHGLGIISQMRRYGTEREDIEAKHSMALQNATRDVIKDNFVFTPDLAD